MEHQLSIDECIEIEIHAFEPYSSNFLKISQGEIYEFKVDKEDKWTDWFIRCNADGFNNFLLWNISKRVYGEKCFKLCGTIKKNEQNHFSIGTNKKWESSLNGELYFFANDSKKLKRSGVFKHYGNNRGSITLKIKRLS